jgi:hypothetical protein
VLARLIKFRELWLTSALVALGIASVFYFGRDGWRDWTPNGGLETGKYFCETVRDGTIRQPINTWSNLGFIAVGLLVAWRTGREGAPGGNLLTGTRSVPLLYACLLVGLGVGSMYLHASWTRWGGIIDVTSMFIYATFLIAHGLARGRTAAAFFATYVAITVPVAGFYLLTRHRSDELFGLVLGVFAVVELTVGRGRADRRWLAASTACLLVAFAIWVPSRLSDGALCCAECWVQGHALWHLLCAAGTWCLYGYFRSETYRPARRSAGD